MAPATSSSNRYLISIMAVTFIALGIDRYLVFWEWSFVGVWSRYDILVVVLLYVCVSIGTLHLFMAKNKLLRALALVYTWLTLGYVGFYVVAEDRNPAVGDGFIMIDGLNEFMLIGVATIRAYGKFIFIALLAAGIISLQLAILGKKVRDAHGKRLPHWLAAALYFFATVYCYMAYMGSNDKTPLYSKTVVVTARTLLKSHLMYNGPREAPKLTFRPSNGSKSHILFVMDESIAGYALGIDGCRYHTTPFLQTQGFPHFNNYGIACSAGNYSSLSNIITTSGIRMDQVPDRSQLSMRQASLFGYARAAGRKAWYIDAQNAHLMNYMMLRDLIDFTYVPVADKFDDSPLYTYDRKGVAKISEILHDASEPAFVFLLKTGAHTVFSDKFPPGMKEEGLIATNKEATHYLKAVKWAVDDFFLELFQALKGLDVIVVYTSDHGVHIDFQAESSDNNLYYGRRNDPSMQEVSVPLFIWTSSEQAQTDFQNAGGFVADNFGAASHFQLFPTFLRLMGYDGEEVRREYGNSLFDPPSLPRRFVSRFFIGNDEDEDEPWFHEYGFLPESVFGSGPENESK